MLDIYVNVYYNIVTKGVVDMDFLERLRVLMEKNNDNNSTLAKKSGIPYTTIDGLFKRGWEKAQISTIQRICDHYGISIDYMVYGVERLSDESQLFAAKFENLDKPGKEAVISVIESQGKRISEYGKLTIRKIKTIETVHDSVLYARYNSKREQKELEEELETIKE